MKRLILILLLSSVMIAVLPQQKMTVVSKGSDATLEGSLPPEMIFAFDGFREATIIMNDGSENKTRVNLHLYTGEVFFLTSSNQILVLAYPLDVSHIVIGSSIWKQIRGAFWEIRTDNGDVQLVASKRTRLTNTRKETGFGGMTATSSVGRLTSMVTQGKQIATFLPAGEYDFETTTEYMLVKGKKAVIANAGSFKKFFPSKKKELNNIFKSQKIDFRNESDLVGLMKVCS